MNGLTKAQLRTLQLIADGKITGYWGKYKSPSFWHAEDECASATNKTAIVTKMAKCGLVEQPTVRDRRFTVRLSLGGKYALKESRK